MTEPTKGQIEQGVTAALEQAHVISRPVLTDRNKTELATRLDHDLNDILNRTGVILTEEKTNNGGAIARLLEQLIRANCAIAQELREINYRAREKNGS